MAIALAGALIHNGLMPRFPGGGEATAFTSSGTVLVEFMYIRTLRLQYILYEFS